MSDNKVRRRRKKKVAPKVEVVLEAVSLKKQNSGAPIQEGSIRQRVLSMIQMNMSNDDIVAMINEQTPESAFNPSQCTWYRSQFAKSLKENEQLQEWQHPTQSATFKEWHYSLPWDEINEFLMSKGE
ncbi:MAG: hypothetical protein COB09_18775 [Thalassobium sp.]|nr:MAG: hypothetical protein COB09_18775 [Thalassobium sp.]